MTDIAELGTLEFLDPNDIDLGDNIRDTTKLDPVFVQSVRDLGILVPVVGRRKDGRVSAKLGHRRVRAAREVGCLVPTRVLEGEDDTVQRLIDQYAENEHRAGLTEPERAAVFQQLALEGLSVPQIARRTGVKKAVIEAGLAVAESKFAGRIATKHQVTLDQAAAIIEFEDDPEVVKSLVAYAENTPAQFAHEVQRQRDERRLSIVREQATAQVREQGFVILDRQPWAWDKDSPASIQDLTVADTGEPVTVEQITGKPWACAYIEVDWDGGVEVHYYVDTPKSHGFKPARNAGSASGPMTEEEKAERREIVANNKAWRSAEVVRREWITGFLARRSVPKDAAHFVATALTEHRHTVGGALTSAHGLASNLLGQSEAERPWEASTLDALAQTQPSKAGHIALAVVLASIESTTGTSTWRRPSLAARAYFTQIGAWGYPLAEVERIVAGIDAEAEAESTEATDDEHREEASTDEE